MKNCYLLLTLLCFTLAAFGQDVNENNSHALIGTCLNPDSGTISLILDMTENCPEADPNNMLAGNDLGFHSGINDWASSVNWDDPNAMTLVNNGNDTFMLTINTMDYYGATLDNITNIRMVANNGIANPGDPWSIFVKDSVDAELFGNVEDCSDLIIHIDQTPTCKDLAQQSSLILFSDAGDSETCIDREKGLIRIDMDYGLACPEGDTAMALVGTPTIGFHSGANNWAHQVAWNDSNAVQLINDGNDNFSAIIDAADYYGIPLDSITDIQMLGNNGPNDPNTTWIFKLEDPKDGGAFGNPTPCSNLALIIDETPSCVLPFTGIDRELLHSFKASPNPFHKRTVLEFNNPNNQSFDLEIIDIAGQKVRTMRGLTGEEVVIERGDLNAGIFFARLIDKKGQFATAKLIVK